MVEFIFNPYFGVIVGVIAIIIGAFYSMTFSRRQRKVYPILRILDGKQILVFPVLIILGACPLIVSALKESRLERANKIAPDFWVEGEGELAQNLVDVPADTARQVTSLFRSGIRDIELQNYAQSIRNFELANDILPLPITLNNLGYVLGEIRQYERAKQTILIGLGKLRSTFQSNKVHGMLLANLARIEVFLGEADGALGHFREARVIFLAEDCLDNVASIDFSMGIALYRQRKFEESEILLKSALEMYKEANNPRGEAETIGALGTLALAQGEYPSAEHLLREAIQMAEEIGAPVLLSNCYMNLGLLLWQTARQSEGQVAFDSSIRVFQLRNAPHILLEVLVNIVPLLFSVGQESQALEKLNVALIISQDRHLVIIEAYILLQRACIKALQAKIADAHEDAAAARDIFLLNGELRMAEIASSLMLIKGDGNCNACKAAFKESLGILTLNDSGVENADLVGLILTQRSSYHLERNEPLKAMPYAYNAAKIFKQTGNKSLELGALGDLIFSSLGIGALEDAESAFKRMNDLIPEAQLSENDIVKLRNIFIAPLVELRLNQEYENTLQSKSKNPQCIQPRSEYIKIFEDGGDLLAEEMPDWFNLDELLSNTAPMENQCLAPVPW